jgi:hypothetical protein
MRRFLRDNGLTLFFGAAFLLTLIGQALSGRAEFNQQQVADNLDPISLGRYVTSADFAVDVVENWQSEYLQFFLYIFVTIWLVQRGSPESKPVDRAGPGTDLDQKVGPYAEPDSPSWAKVAGWRRTVFSNSLCLVMGGIFLMSWLAQSITGVVAYNEHRLSQLQAPISWLRYLGNAEFWNRTLQNWQSELLAVASMVILSVYLRQRGSPESKPVGTPHVKTAEEN